MGITGGFLKRDIWLHYFTFIFSENPQVPLHGPTVKNLCFIAGMSNSNYLGAAKATKASEGAAKVFKNSLAGYI